MNTQRILPFLSLALFTSAALHASDSLELKSSAFVDGGSLPLQFTCEGEGVSPPLNWSGVPAGTQSLVVIMDHQPDRMPESHPHPAPKITGHKTTPPPPKPNQADGLRWYWSLYNIPAHISSINAGEIAGLIGSNVVNDQHEYAPPCSKGPGLKRYTFHLYALSTPLNMTSAASVSAATLRANMKGVVLDSDSLTVSVERSCQMPPKPRPKQDTRQTDHREPPSTLPLCAKAMSTTTPASIDNK
jgi:phosphatidylethanolamine-binding protein (PEBP) family uncharacterized protein